MAMKTKLQAKLPERYVPEFSIPTEEKYTIDLGWETHVLKYNPHLHAEQIKQWVNKTQPKKKPFDDKSEIISLNGLHIPGSDITPTFISPTKSDLLEEEWKQQEFNRIYADIACNYEIQSANEKTEIRKINEKINKYKKAFLKGFYEARIRRIEANKWLYGKLHVNPEHVKEKYRQLMYASQIHYISSKTEQYDQPMDEIEKENKISEIHENEDIKSMTQATQEAELESETASIYSFVPERDNIMLQDVNSPPQIRGFGRDKQSKYNSSIRLLHLDHWISPDIQQWLNEKRLENHWEKEESSIEDDVISDRNSKQLQREAELKYEQIPGTRKLSTWLGPKVLAGKEIDLENFRKTSRVNENESIMGNDQHKKASIVEEKLEDDELDSSITENENPSKDLLKRLIQSQSKDYYRLWYGTHDMYNTTPFLEARLQRLMREIFTKKEWSMYSSHLKNKYENKPTEHNINDNLPSN
ncbi:hypothetical protein PGB90_006504 [Kerria lacca]